MSVYSCSCLTLVLDKFKEKITYQKFFRMGRGGGAADFYESAVAG
jgi:hypothetical protein